MRTHEIPIEVKCTEPILSGDKKYIIINDIECTEYQKGDHIKFEVKDGMYNKAFHELNKKEYEITHVSFIKGGIYAVLGIEEIISEKEANPFLEEKLAKVPKETLKEFPNVIYTAEMKDNKDQMISIFDNLKNIKKCVSVPVEHDAIHIYKDKNLICNQYVPFESQEELREILKNYDGRTSDYDDLAVVNISSNKNDNSIRNLCFYKAFEKDGETSWVKWSDISGLTLEEKIYLDKSTLPFKGLNVEEDAENRDNIIDIGPLFNEKNQPHLYYRPICKIADSIELIMYTYLSCHNLNNIKELDKTDKENCKNIVKSLLELSIEDCDTEEFDRAFGKVLKRYKK